MEQVSLTEVPCKELLWIQAPRMLFWYCLVLHLSPLRPACRQLSSKASQTLLPRLNTAPPVTEAQCQISHPAGPYCLCPPYTSGKGTEQFTPPRPARDRSEALLKSEATGCTDTSSFSCKERYMLIHMLLNFYMKCTLHHLCFTSVQLKKRREKPES